MSAGIVPKLDIKRSLATATRQYHQALLKDDEALEYLLEGRKITREALEYFQLGVVREPEAGHEAYEGRISIPYLTPGGVTSLRFKSMGGDRAKVLDLPGATPRIYNSSALRGASRVYIVEGEPDTWAGWQAGLSIVGFPGATTWTRETGPIFARVFFNREVIVLAQPDDAGLEMAKDIHRYLGGCKIISMPVDYDVSSYVHAHGEAQLRKLIDA